MGYRAIRTFGLVSVALTVLVVGRGLWEAFAPGSRAAEYLPTAANAMWLAFVLIGLVAFRVSATLEAQSLAIDSLRQRLAELQAGK